MLPLCASLPDFVMRREQPVHRALRAEVGALVEQRRVDLGRRQIDEARRVERVEHVLLLGGRERARRPAARPRAEHRGTLPSVVRGGRHAQRGTQRRDAERGAQGLHGAQERRPVGASSGGGCICSQSAETFFWRFRISCGLRAAVG